MHWRGLALKAGVELTTQNITVRAWAGALLVTKPLAVARITSSMRTRGCNRTIPRAYTNNTRRRGSRVGRPWRRVLSVARSPGRRSHSAGTGGHLPTIPAIRPEDVEREAGVTGGISIRHRPADHREMAAAR